MFHSICFCCFKKKNLSLNDHMLLYVRDNNFIISNENTYTITLIMNECIRYIDEVYENRTSSMKYSMAIQCLHNILYKELSDDEEEMLKIMNLINACVFVHYGE